jgi:D-lactate dehydrogenase (cytochrome)
MTLPEVPTLFVEFHGSDASVREQSERFGEIAAEFGGGRFEWATKAEDRTRLWQARHDAYWASMALRPGCRSIATDVCVPISRLAECVEETQRDLAETGLLATIVGHVGDGNFHVLPLIDPEDAGEVTRAHAFVERLIDRALAMEGTCTGEHGVGQKKIKHLVDEHPAATLAMMRSIKRTLDPANIMNPGKIVTL